jgi:predicted DCC family thiol-disulfide oxidoreductase YuxK
VEAWGKGRIEVQPWQMIPTRLAAAGLTAEDGMYQVWTVAPDGTVLGGPAAVNAALALIWWARPLTWLYRLPGMPWLENKVYRWVANNRYRMPGGTAECSIAQTQQVRSSSK